MLADAPRESEVGFPVAGVVAVVEDAADAARLVAMRQVEILLAVLLHRRIVSALVALARVAHGIVEFDGVRKFLLALIGQQGRQICATTEP